MYLKLLVFLKFWASNLFPVCGPLSLVANASCFPAMKGGSFQ